MSLFRDILQTLSDRNFPAACTSYFLSFVWRKDSFFLIFKPAGKYDKNFPAEKGRIGIGSSLSLKRYTYSPKSFPFPSTQVERADHSTVVPCTCVCFLQQCTIDKSQNSTTFKRRCIHPKWENGSSHAHATQQSSKVYDTDQLLQMFSMGRHCVCLHSINVHKIS